VVRDVDEWGITLTVSGEWLAIAEAWGYDALIRLARAAHDEANEHYTRAQKDWTRRSRSRTLRERRRREKPTGPGYP
jgi:hypothetical protein